MIEDEKKNAAAESATSSQDAIEKRPETDFHFFSDSEVTKYIIYISLAYIINVHKLIYIYRLVTMCSTGIRIPDRLHLFSRTQNSKYVKLRKRVARERTTRLTNRVGDGVNCPVHLQNMRRICRREV